MSDRTGEDPYGMGIQMLRHGMMVVPSVRGTLLVGTIMVPMGMTGVW